MHDASAVVGTVTMARMPPLFPHSIPTFASLDEERTYRKQHLAAAFRVWARLGYDEGPAGHITVARPGNDPVAMSPGSR